MKVIIAVSGRENQRKHSAICNLAEPFSFHVCSIECKELIDGGVPLVGKFQGKTIGFVSPAAPCPCQEECLKNVQKQNVMSLYRLVVTRHDGRLHWACGRITL